MSAYERFFFLWQACWETDPKEELLGLGDWRAKTGGSGPGHGETVCRDQGHRDERQALCGGGWHLAEMPSGRCDSGSEAQERSGRGHTAESA